MIDKNVLVVGSSGFLGKNVVRKLNFSDNTSFIEIKGKFTSRFVGALYE